MGQKNLQQQMLYVLATFLIVHELSSTTKTSTSYFAMAIVVDASSTSMGSSSLKSKEMVVNTFAHASNPSLMNSAGMVNRMSRHTVQGLQPQQEQKQIEDPSLKLKRSFATGGAWSSTAFNRLTGLAPQNTIRSSSYGHSYDIQQQQQEQEQHQQLHQQYTEAKPIYEEQQENDYAEGATSTGVGNAAALHSAIYNLQTAGTHNAAVSTNYRSSNGGSDGFLPSWNFGKLSTSFIASKAGSTPYGSSSISNSNEKISEGNFLHHYDTTSAFNEYTPTPHQHEYQPTLHQLPYQVPQQQLQHENFYNSVEHTEVDTSTSNDEHDNSNYLPTAPSSASALHYDYEHQQQQEKQPDVINYIPYPVVKKQHVPVRENIQIPVSHAVIIPVSKPVPIHIPVSQNVQVPIEKELKIPVERVVPYPIEKHVPVPVEKRVPYPVVKYVPIKIPRPFPVKVPVFKTVLHKVKGWW